MMLTLGKYYVIQAEGTMFCGYLESSSEFRISLRDACLLNTLVIEEKKWDGLVQMKAMFPETVRINPAKIIYAMEVQPEFIRPMEKPVQKPRLPGMILPTEQ